MPNQFALKHIARQWYVSTHFAPGADGDPAAWLRAEFDRLNLLLSDPVWTESLPLGLVEVVEAGEAVVEIGLLLLDEPAVKPPDPLRLRDLPPIALAACVTHYGDHRLLPQSTDRLRHWLEEQGYEVAGPERVIYLHLPPSTDTSTAITEIQFPVHNRHAADPSA